MKPLHNTVAAKIMTSRGDDEVKPLSDLILEVTDREGSDIEIGFDYGKERIYLQFNIVELLKMATDL